MMRCIGSPSPDLVRMLLATLVVLGISGCGQNATRSRHAASDNAETQLVAVNTGVALADKSREQLRALIEAAATDYEQTAKLYASSGGTFRLKNMQTRLNEQLAAWEALERHADALPADQLEAIRAQTELLARGIETAAPDFEPLVRAHRDRLAAERPSSDEAAQADALLVWNTHLRSLENESETAEALATHAQHFPQSPTGPKLYARLAQMLSQAGRIDEAKHVCETVAASYTDDQLVQPVRHVLGQIKSAEQAEYQRRLALEARARQFGGHLDGYFVLFLRPKKLKYMAAVDYVVAHGLQEAIHYADNADAWELEGWFPESKQGANQAQELADTLLKKNTISIPTFQ